MSSFNFRLLSHVNLLSTLADADGSGSIDRKEFRAAAAELTVPLQETKLNRAFKKIDTDESGRISYREFEHWVVMMSVSRVRYNVPARLLV